MDEGRRRLLYLDGFTVSDPSRGTRSSDAIGYGITASTVIREGLRALGFDLRRAGQPTVSAEASHAKERLSWILSNYRDVLDALVHDPPDGIFCFHIFAGFPVEIRRMVLDVGRSTPIVGYTHGSHWDPTDAFRFEVYPGMELLDLANLYVLDRVLLVSEYMRRTLYENVRLFNKRAAEQLDAKAAVVGLPLDVRRIDACRVKQRSARPVVVFNHAPVSSKNPDLFARVMARILRRYDVDVLFTRDFRPGKPGGDAVAALAARFPGQVILGRDMPLDDYYRALWAADLQVSTATHESLGVSTLEAMYTANCCILPRLGSYPEICGDHPDVLYDLGEDALEERLRYFLDQPAKRRAVARELQRMTAKYQPDIVVAEVARVLREVMSPSS